MPTRFYPALVLALLTSLGCSADAAREGTASSASAEMPAATIRASGSALPPSSASATGSGAPSARPAQSPEQDQAAVKQVFIDYRTAIGAKKGDDAAALAASRTIEYFEETRKAALTMPEAELRKRPFMDRFMILVIRARVDAAKLRKMDGRALFTHAVNEGMVGENTGALEPERAEIDGDTAHLAIRAGKQTIEPKDGFRFDREKGAWKLDVMSITAFAEPTLKKMFAQIDPDLDVAILKVLEQLAKKPVSKTIWKAPDAAP